MEDTEVDRLWKKALDRALTPKDLDDKEINDAHKSIKKYKEEIKNDI